MYPINTENLLAIIHRGSSKRKAEEEIALQDEKAFCYFLAAKK